MSIRRLQLVSLMALPVLATGGAYAASPPPNSPPIAAHIPGLALTPASPHPFNFRFSERATGTGFRPGEHVRITVEHAAAAPVTATADANGVLSASISFTWVFCGPNAGLTPPPLVLATGSAGSHARLTLLPEFCPGLVTSSSPAVTVPPVVVGGPPEPLPNPRTTVTQQQVRLAGFGFAPYETVQLVERGVPVPVTAVVVKADAFGRIQASLRVAVPTPCSALAGRAWIQATGDRGTVAALLLGFSRPVNLTCPVTGRTTVPPDNPPVPSNGATGAAVGFRLLSSSVRLGGVEHVRLSLPGAAPATLTIQYPGGRTQVLHRSGTGRPTTIHWHVPRTVVAGRAGVTMTVPSLGITLAQSFSVR